MTKPELIRTWMFALYDTGFYAEYEVSEENIIRFLEHPDITPFVNCKDNNSYTLLFTHKGSFESFAEEQGFEVKDLIGMYLYILRVFDTLLSQTSEAKQRRLLNAYKALYGLNLDYTRDSDAIFRTYPGLNESTVDVVYAKILLGYSFYEIDRNYDLDKVMVESALSRVNSKMWNCHVDQLTSYNRPLHLACVKKGLIPLQPSTPRARELWTAAEYIRCDVPII